MMESNDTKIPMDPDTKLVKAEDGNSVDATYYRSLIGSLRYLLHTRPDLSYLVGLLSRFMQDPKDHHLKLVKQVIRYIKGTKVHGIIYKKECDCKITGYSDSSYGINTDHEKETTGIVFYFRESPITWCTQKQPTIALSSCESEFMAATGAACQALWLKRLLSELTGWEGKRITLKVDNISAIALVRNPVFHGRSKHIDIRYHFIRECVENGHINVEHDEATIKIKEENVDIISTLLLLLINELIWLAWEKQLIEGGYRGFYSRNTIQLTPKVANGIHKRGGTIIVTSRGDYDNQKTVNSIEDRGINHITLEKDLESPRRGKLISATPSCIFEYWFFLGSIQGVNPTEHDSSSTLQHKRSIATDISAEIPSVSMVSNGSVTKTRAPAFASMGLTKERTTLELIVLKSSSSSAELRHSTALLYWTTYSFIM
nr:ribonuclease H-like domain, reverse transcriptase, RNA-dependent DNA polymerase [Tanacetum cinerariifolium]